ncbi:MAG: hypothetical protein V3V33_08030 [Candidatus Lokiarchaeia archaeon]
MTYTPFELRVLPIFIYYIFVSIFAVIVSIKMYYKWRERQVPPPLYLTLVFSFLTAALIILSIGLAEAVITGFYKEIYRISLPLAYCMVVCADIFLFIFASYMTNKGRRAFPIIALVGIVIIIILFLPWNWWGVPQVDYEGELSIRIYTTGGLVLFSFLIYFYIALICQKIKHNVDDKIMYTGLKLLFYSMISLVLLFLMLVMDTLMITFFNHPGYSEFTYIAWIFGLIFIILSYLSLIMPEWLVNRIKKKYGISN